MFEKQKVKKSKQKNQNRAYHCHSKDTLEKTIQVQKARKVFQNRKIGGIGASV